MPGTAYPLHCPFCGARLLVIREILTHIRRAHPLASPRVGSLVVDAARLYYGFVRTSGGSQAVRPEVAPALPPLPPARP